MKLLIIEDNVDSVKRIMDFAEEKSWESSCVDFKDAEGSIKEFEPDIVVLDWMFDIEETERGNDILKAIWDKNFRPVIIFSAIADTITLDKDYPLITKIAKGDEEIVVEKLQKWEQYAPVISKLRDDMNRALIDSLYTIKMFKSSEFPGDEVVKYMVTKRASNYFNKDFEGINPPAWIQYIYPTMSDTLLVCDILRKVSSEADHEKEGSCDEYSLILTPSCDIKNDRTPQLLIARCECKENYSEIRLRTTENVESGNGKEKVKNLMKDLNRGYSEYRVALPKLPEIIPHLTVNLKNTDLILKNIIAMNYSSVVSGTHEYYRVASIDSPFREQIVWAHMINSCRPGIPDRDVQKWAQEILTV